MAFRDNFTGLSGALQQSYPLLLAMSQSMRQGQGPFAGAPQGLAAMMQMQEKRKAEASQKAAQGMMSDYFGSMMPQTPVGPIAQPTQGQSVARDAMSALGKAPYDATGVSQDAQNAFTGLQSMMANPLKVTSAYRTPEHNASVGGAKHSQHIEGNAFDVDVSGMSRAEQVQLIKNARQAGFKGIGVYDGRLHFDVGSDRAWGSDYTRGSLPQWANAAITGQPVPPNNAAQIISSPHVPDAVKQMVLAKMQPPSPPKPTDDIREYNFAVGQGFKGSFEDWQLASRKAGASNISVTGGNAPDARPIVATPDKGIQRRWDAENQTWVDEPIPGSGPAQEAEDAIKAEEVQAQQTLFQADTVTSTVDELRKLTNRKGILNLPETGIIGDKLARWGLNQEAVDVKNKIATLESAIAFDRLQRMREASKTGGALGQVSERELTLLAADMGSLRQSSSREDFNIILDRVDKRYRDIIAKFEADPDVVKAFGSNSGSDPLGIFK